ncbi:hypothetical protein F4808DRAFT_450666 [Astrocystis sublimbata]|nr:hypothetical protein F4808DRAFT_450666 [Astrocystis sublimbata]
MALLESTIRPSWPGLSPSAPRRKYRKGPRGERMQPLCRARKSNVCFLAVQYTARVAWDRDEKDDGRRLALDPTVALPGERQRHIPRLERQGAFRAPNSWELSEADVVVNDAELYRLGILYDRDDYDPSRGFGFCLEAIKHEQPVYSLRPARRTKKARDRRVTHKQEDLQLSVSLLSTYLGDDAAIARFFAPVGDVMPMDTETFHQEQSSLAARDDTINPLTVIYELAEPSKPSLSPTPRESDVLELVSDTEDDVFDESEENIGCSGGWAMVSNTDVNTREYSGDAAHVDMTTNAREETTWVFVAGNDL